MNGSFLNSSEAACPLIQATYFSESDDDSFPMVKPEVHLGGDSRVRTERCRPNKAAREAAISHLTQQSQAVKLNQPLISKDKLSKTHALDRGRLRHVNRVLVSRQHNKRCRTRPARVSAECSEDLHPSAADVRKEEIRLKAKGLICPLAKNPEFGRTLLWIEETDMKTLVPYCLKTNTLPMYFKYARRFIYSLYLYGMSRILPLHSYTKPYWCDTHNVFIRTHCFESSPRFHILMQKFNFIFRLECPQLDVHSLHSILLNYITKQHLFQLKDVHSIADWHKWLIDHSTNMRNPNFSTLTFDRKLIEMMLIISGVEQNPGPPKVDPTSGRLRSDSTTSSSTCSSRSSSPGPDNSTSVMPVNSAPLAASSQCVTAVRQTSGKSNGACHVHRSSRRSKRAQAVTSSLQDSLAEANGKVDALNVKIQDQKDTIIDLQDKNANAATQILAQTAIINEARRLGFVQDNGSKPTMTYAFHGQFVSNNCSTFDDEKDPLITINVYSNGMWVSNAVGNIYSCHISPAALAVAVNSVACSDKNLRLRNIYNGLVQSKAVQEEVKKMSSEEKITFARTLELRAFLLTGTVVGTGRCRWLNDCEEWVSPKYTVEPPLGWEEQCKGVIFAQDSQKFESQVCRSSRAAPYVVQGLIPHIPDAADFGTLVAGLCKRLFPKLPARSPQVLQEISVVSTELLDYIRSHQDPFDATHLQDLVEKALEHHPVRERDKILEGVHLYLNNPNEAFTYYLNQPYKCFIKLESYPDGTFKPPRFIMSLPLMARGIQIAAMAVILHKIEVGTRLCNCKGLTSDEITIKLLKKFINCHEAAETDFSSFESCIGFDLKNVCENLIFEGLAETPESKAFIQQCLKRAEVSVKGPCFTIPHFHHIRMSGDYWTSLGNLITNIVLSCYCTGRPVDEMIRDGMFEGDDGCYPAPSNPERVITMAARAGVKLTFQIAPVSCLSFCGNHFENINGNLQRFRDPQKCLANATILFNAPRGSLAHDRMLQRAKMMAYLVGPIIPDMWIFACVVERFTRDVRVDHDLLMRMGLAKLYTPYSLEECVPKYLQFFFGSIPLSDQQFCRRIYRMNKLAGGKCAYHTIVQMVDIASKAGPCKHCVLPNPLPVTTEGAWYARDGSRFTHKEGFFFPAVVENQNRFTNESYNTHSMVQPRSWRELVPHAEFTREGVRPSEHLTIWDFVPAGVALLCLIVGLWVLFFSMWYGVFSSPTNTSVVSESLVGDEASSDWFLMILVWLAAILLFCLSMVTCVRKDDRPWDHPPKAHAT